MGGARRTMDTKSNGRPKPSKLKATVGIINEDRRGILTDSEIKSRLLMDISNPLSIVVTPLFDEESAFDTDSIDLRLGTHFLFPRVPPRAYYCPDANSRDSFHMKVHVPLGDFLVVPPHSTVLGQTLEFIKLPFDVSGEILTKS